ncbi:MAG TPA: aspartate/glutamate racemase family protein [Rhodocyclaceae bacterium]
MRTIGLIGGMSWESTLPYYRIINETVRDRLGGLHSAKIVLVSIDFHEVEALQRAGEWEAAGRLLVEAGQTLVTAGADAVVLCTNTMHKLADPLAAALRVPLLHIADPTAATIAEHGLRTVGLLGTRFTMEEDFYRARLQQRHGLGVVVPDAPDRELVHRVIYDELCQGRLLDNSRAAYRAVIARLVGRGAQGIILGCTEIALLVGADDSPVPMFDTAAIHARSAAEWAIGDER